MVAHEVCYHDGFAPAGRWEELSPTNLDSPQVA
jgi:hypothetical protein